MSAIAPEKMAPLSGRTTMASYMLPPALHQIDVFTRDGAAIAEIGDQDRQPDGGFRRRDRQHDQRVDLADDIAEERREGDEVDVDGEQNELDRHQNDDDVLSIEKDAEHPEREQNGGNREVMAKSDDHGSPCPDLTLTISTAVAGRRATWSAMFCRRTPGLC